MKKLILLTALICIAFSYGQSYTAELKKVNDILKEFDSSSLNTLTVVEDRKLVFNDGYMEKWMPINKIDRIESNEKEVNILCSNGEDCVRFDYLMDNEAKMSFPAKRYIDIKAFTMSLQKLIDKLKSK